jgi:hypothetical protein
VNVRLTCVDTVVGTVNVYERWPKPHGGCRLVGMGKYDDWTPRTRVDRQSLEDFRLNCLPLERESA